LQFFYTNPVTFDSLSDGEHWKNDTIAKVTTAGGSVSSKFWKTEIPDGQPLSWKSPKVNNSKLLVRVDTVRGAELLLAQ
jgi:hypothetical protein